MAVLADSGKYIFAGLGHTSDYYTKYEDITGELIAERIEVMDFESLIALMEAKVKNSKKKYIEIKIKDDRRKKRERNFN